MLRLYNINYYKINPPHPNHFAWFIESFSEHHINSQNLLDVLYFAYKLHPSCFYVFRLPQESSYSSLGYHNHNFDFDFTPVH